MRAEHDTTRSHSHSPIMAALVDDLCAQDGMVFFTPDQQQAVLSDLEKTPHQRDLLTAFFRHNEGLFVSIEGVGMILSAITAYRKTSIMLREAATYLEKPFGADERGPEDMHILNEDRVDRHRTIVEMADAMEQHADGLAHTLHDGIQQTQLLMATTAQ